MYNIFKILIIVLAFTVCNYAAVSVEEQTKIEKAVDGLVASQAAGPRKLLIFTRCEGFRHDAIPYINTALELIGQKTGAYTTVISEDMAVFTPAFLSDFDAICFNNTTMLKFNDQQKNALMDFVKGGKGIVGIHGATDNFYDWPEAAEMMGGTFDGHPWTANGTWAIKIEDAGHPLVAGFKQQRFKIKEEIYRTKQMNLRQNSRVIIALDLSDAATANASGIKPEDIDIPVSWLRDYGKGRVFYCGIGHNKHLIWDTEILSHYLAGIQFAFGDLPANTAPISLAQAQVQEFTAMLDSVRDYDYGDDDKILRQIKRTAITQADASQRQLMLQTLEEFIVSEASLAAKEMVCRVLAVLGRESTVAPLVTLLAEEETIDIALYALGSIEGLAVDQALIKLLPQTQGRARLGIINIIGRRQNSYAVENLQDIARQGEPAQQIAAINALGHIGNHQAAEVLQQILANGFDAKIKNAAMDALLRCGENFIASSDMLNANKTYRLLYEMAETDYLRIAALNGLLNCYGDKDDELVVEVLTAGDMAASAAVMPHISRTSSERKLQAYIQLLPQLPAPVRVQLIWALAQTSQSGVLPAIIKAVDDENEQVRIMALNVLPEVGGLNEISLLLKKAVNSPRPEQAAARESLQRLRGGDIDAKMLEMLTDADAAAKVELIRTLGARNIASDIILKPLIHLAVNDASSVVRQEALRVIASAAKAKDFDAMVDLIVELDNERDRALAVGAAEAAFRNGTEDLTALEQKMAIDDSGKRLALIDLAGRIADDKFLPVLYQLTTSDDPATLTAVIRALSQWRTDKPIEKLYQIAQDSDNRRDTILAFRGFVRLIGLDSLRDSQQTAKYCQQAMALAETAQDKRQVLAAMLQSPGWEVFLLALEYINDAEIADEAAGAVVDISQAVYGYSPGEVCTKLEGLIASDNTPEAAKTKAKEIIQQISASGAYITNWMISGPYRQQDQGHSELFDIAFAPEIADQQAIWHNLSAANRGQRMVDLIKEHNAQNCVAYLSTAVYLPAAQKVSVAIGSDDGAKIWFNGNEVFQRNIARGFAFGSDKFQAELKPGWNIILVKVTQAGGGWAFAMEITDQAGQPFTGMRIDPARIK